VRYEAVGQSFGRLNQGTGAAATVLLKIMLDPTNSAASRVHAADRVIQHSKSHLELEDFQLRLRRLEQVAAEKKDADKLSDAHGKGKVPAKPEARHAELAVNLAGAMATFLVQTWEAQNTGKT
jgi:Abortive infection C-terminus